MLLEEIERYAITAGIMRITSEVSLTARPFFEKKGYVVEEEQKRKANQLSLTNFWMAREVTKIQRYEGRIPACGVFCGGCPTYTREKNPCKGAELNSSRCEKCKTFHLCCLEKEIHSFSALQFVNNNKICTLIQSRLIIPVRAGSIKLCKQDISITIVFFETDSFLQITSGL